LSLIRKSLLTHFPASNPSLLKSAFHIAASEISQKHKPGFPGQESMISECFISSHLPPQFSE
jgi:hypothetical protein